MHTQSGFNEFTYDGIDNIDKSIQFTNGIEQTLSCRNAMLNCKLKKIYNWTVRIEKHIMAHSMRKQQQQKSSSCLQMNENSIS